MAPEVFIGATTDAAGSNNCKGCDVKPLPVDGNYAIYTDHPGSEGEKKWAGVIRVKKPDGTYQHYPFQSSYVAQKPSSVVAAEKMNVLYIGVDNPMAISVPGVSNDKVKVSIEGGGGSLKPNTTTTGGSGHYFANVTTVGPATIKVSAEIAGRVTSMGSFPYRVKRVPDPIATISNSEGGSINKNLLAAGTLIPLLKNFDFELFFKITSFKITIVGKGKDLIEYDAQGNQLTPQMREAVSKLRAGDKVYFEYIKAKMASGADQSTRSLSSMGFTIQ
jgi:gliding motility-associated protein GldM